MKGLPTFDDLIKIKDNWSSFLGLIFTSLIIFSITTVTAITLNNGFVLNLNFILYLKISTAILLFHFVIWFLYKLKRKILPVEQNKLNVVFSFDNDKESTELYQKLYSYFKKRIEMVDGYDNFRIKDISEQFKFKNNSQAEKFIIEENIILMIWGYSETGNLNKEKMVLFKPNFSYNFHLISKTPVEKMSERQIFSSHVQTAVDRRNWEIALNESLIQLRIVAENFFEVSLYIVARSIITVGYLRLANEYCVEILKSLKNKDSSTYPDYDKFRKMVLNTHVRLLEMLIEYHAWVKPDLDLAEKYALETLTIIFNSFSALTHLARIYWLKNNKILAKQYAHRAKKVFPSSNINRFNDAFFALDEMDFPKAISIYKKIKNIPNEMGNILTVINFLDNEYDKTDKPSMLFASGYLNYYYADEDRGKELLNTFVDKIDDNDQKQKYLLLINTAKSILNI